MAKKLHRRWVGIERDAQYAQVAAERIAQITPGDLSREVFVFPRKRAQARLPFGVLLEQGLLQPGQTLFFRDDDARPAQVLANGQLRCGAVVGSIHEVARALLDAPCNGWEVWFFRAPGQPGQPIDRLRAQARAMRDGA